MNLHDVCLQAGDARLLLSPRTGGSIARYWWGRAGGEIDWLRPGPGAASANLDPGAMGCFPLVPYSNRIRNGRFRFGGREVALPLNFGDHPHSIHGHGWQAPWKTVSRAENESTLEFHHPADAWPFEYRARQSFRLVSTHLSVTLTVENLGGTTMPAGLGFHPYFPRTPGTRLTAAVDQVWLTDREVMPARRVAPPPDWDLNRGMMVDRVALDNVFTVWKRRASIEWPERKCRLTITGGDGMDFLVVYTPRAQPFFCAEPVSHCTDAFNRVAAGERDTGMRELAPGESWAVTMELRPEVLD
jgi:aldose 1-epimerase